MAKSTRPSRASARRARRAPHGSLLYPDARRLISQIQVDRPGSTCYTAWLGGGLHYTVRLVAGGTVHEVRSPAEWERLRDRLREVGGEGIGNREQGPSTIPHSLFPTVVDR